ncbi:MAG: hypothetical protein U1D30_10765 [Planctomycetota bacterium]
MSTIGSVGITSVSQLRRTLDRVGRNATSEAAADTNGESANSLDRPRLSQIVRASAQTNFVNVTVNANAASGFQRLVPVQPPGPGRQPGIASPSGGSSGSLSSKLSSVSPKLAQGIEALLDFIRRQNPDAAKALEDSLEAMLDGNASSDASAGALNLGATPAPAATVSIQQENVQFALEATFAQLQQEVDGGASLSIEQIQLTFQANLTQITGLQRSDPLVLDLDGNGTFETTTPFDGHDFDLLGTGKQVRAATVAGGDAYLAYDRNGNGSIDDGTELFGDQNGAVGGFAELAKYDDDGNGQVDANDSVFASLMLFRDSNRDGRTDMGELVPISEARIASIQLHAKESDETSNGNQVARVGTFVRDNGETGRVGDMLLNYLA